MVGSVWKFLTVHMTDLVHLRLLNQDLGKLRHLGAGKRGYGAGQDVATQPPPFQVLCFPHKSSACTAYLRL